MYTVHSGFSFAASIDKTKITNVINLLDNFNKNQGNPTYLHFDSSPSTLFVSSVVIPAQPYSGETLPDTLLFLTSFSGPVKRHLKELVAVCGTGLRELFKYCIDFPPGGLASDGELETFLIKHKYTDTFYSGFHCITKASIGKEELLRKEIKDFINQGQRTDIFKGKNASQIRNLIQNYIKQKGQTFRWAQTPQRRNLFDIWKLYSASIIFIISVLSLVSSLAFLFIFKRKLFWIAFTLIIFLIAVALAGIIYIESGENKVAKRVSDNKMRLIAASQNNPIINELTAAGPIKKGRIRRFVFKTVLKIASLFRAKIPTICTARWVATDGGKRLVFISNFTNTSDSYVRDFINSRGSAMGINFLFGHGEGHPKTKFLAWDGSLKDPEGFMNVFHKNQHITQFWYAPFKDLTVDRINNNRKIRNGLFGFIFSRRKKQLWLNRL